MRYTLGLIIILLTASCYVGEDLPADQETWLYDLPSNQELDQAFLQELDQRVKREEFQVIEGLMIIRNDRLVFENYYYNGLSRDYTKNIGNGGLSITLTALGIAEDLGFISVNDRINAYLPEYNDVFSANPDKALITINHLLLHRSGLSWNETIKGFFDPANNINQMKSSDDWVAFVLSQPLEALPGQRYSFNTAGGVLIAKVIENATGQSYEEFLNQYLYNPLDISSISIQTDPSGNYNGGDGYSISLIDWTKIGYLFLQNGLWQGRRVIDPNFVAESISIQFQISNNESVGYFWSFFGDNFEGFFSIDHEEIYYISGELGQSLFIIPSEQMIVAILSDNFFGFGNLSLNLFSETTRSILQTVE